MSDNTLKNRRLIVGLGNPGKRYVRTRHNLGARVVLILQRHLGQPTFRRREQMPARVSLGDHLLALPTTFMNDSGRAVRALLARYRIALHHLLVVHDDKDLAFGKLKLQKGRSSAGHRGVHSVMDALGSQDFWRLRIGIGAPPAGMATEAYVLAPFRPEEERQLSDSIIPDALRILTAHASGADRA